MQIVYIKKRKLIRMLCAVNCIVNLHRETTMPSMACKLSSLKVITTESVEDLRNLETDPFNSNISMCVHEESGARTHTHTHTHPHTQARTHTDTDTHTDTHAPHLD